MKKVKKKIKKYCEYNTFNIIPFHSNFLIDKTGTIVMINDLDNKKDEVYPVKVFLSKKGYPSVTIFNDNAEECTYKIAKLLLNTYVGDFDYPIIYKDMDILNYNLSNLLYDLSKAYIERIDNSIFIDNDEFKLITSFIQNRYYVNNKGYVYDEYKRNFLKRQFVMGYLKASFMLPPAAIKVNNYLDEYIHRITYETWFNTKIPEGFVIDHLDGRKYNNSIENFEMVTRSENTYRAIDLGLTKAKWNRNDIRYFADCISKNINVNEVIDELQLTDKDEIASLKRIYRLLINKKIYKDILKEYDIDNYDKFQNKYLREDMLKLEDAHKYCKAMSEGKSYQQIMDDDNIPTEKRLNMRVQLYKLRTGKTYPEISSKYNFDKFDHYRLADNTVAQIKAVLIENAKNDKYLKDTDIANHFGISKERLNMIKNGTSYPDIAPSPYVYPENKNIIRDNSYSLPNDLIHTCCKYISQNKTANELADDIHADEEFRKRLNRLFIRIRNQGAYSHIASQYDFSNYDANYHKNHHPRKDGYTNEQIHIMCRMMQEGKSLADIKDALGITKDHPKYNSIKTTLYNLRNGKVYPEIASEYDFSNYNSKKK